MPFDIYEHIFKPFVNKDENPHLFKKKLLIEKIFPHDIWRHSETTMWQHMLNKQAEEAAEQLKKDIDKHIIDGIVNGFKFP